MRKILFRLILLLNIVILTNQTFNLISSSVDSDILFYDKVNWVIFQADANIFGIASEVEEIQIRYKFDDGGSPKYLSF
jgi:hypothetical protein